MTRIQLMIVAALGGLLTVWFARGVIHKNSSALDEKTQRLARATGPVEPVKRLMVERESPPRSEAREEGPVEPSTGDRTVRGAVVETIDASRYTYIHLKDDQGELLWAAVPKAVLSPGETVTVISSLVMENFESKTLGRTFPSVVFGVLATADRSLNKGDAGI